MTTSLFDLTGVQDFIFGARRLRANLGASWLAHIALHKDGWLGELARPRGAEVLWSGGGNAMVRSDSLPAARALAQALSARMIDRAPGLGLACAHDDEGGSYGERNARLQRAIARQKQARLPDLGFDGGGVCEPCGDTAEAAVTADKDGKALGASIQARELAEERARERLQGLFEPAEGRIWCNESDKISGTKHEESAIAVIHMDGNAMGAKFAAAAGIDLERVQELSRDVEKHGEATLHDGMAWIEQQLEDIDFELNVHEGKEVFPARPVVFGGDDITLICDGRLAIDLAAKMLKIWKQKSGHHACAGVALVRAHYPFYRAVKQAYALCHESKMWMKRSLPQRDVSLLSWSLHRAGGILNDTAQSRLTSRPYVVEGDAPPGKPWRAWRWLREECLVELRGEAWAEHRAQLMGIATALATDEPGARRALDRLRDRHGLRLPCPEHHHLDISGFEQGETPYPDAIELLDLVRSSP